MTKNSQDLLASTNRDSQELVTASLSNLNERVQLLEKQAQKQGEKLRQANRKWKEYRVSYIKVFGCMKYMHRQKEEEEKNCNFCFRCYWIFVVKELLKLD